MYTLGIDLSTQSLSATLLQSTEGKNEGERGIRFCANWSIPFRDLAEKYALDPRTLCIKDLSQKYPGFYAQPPQMFLEALDLLLAQIQAEGAPLHRVLAINCSAQQHGQLWLNAEFELCCQKLRQPGHAQKELSLNQLFDASYAYPAAPIWMCSQTKAEAKHLLEHVGNDKLLQLCGSAAPLRFSGLVLRWLARREKTAYRQCRYVHLLSSWLAAVFTAKSNAAIDWGSGAGTLMMDYRARNWSQELLASLAEGLASEAGGPSGGAAELRSRLPELASPVAEQGKVASYFLKYGFAADCKVLTGSGDNPQSKVCQAGDLLSLGSSFVAMSRTAKFHPKFHPWANAMYDGLGQPFSFTCRSNGALVWDAVRQSLGLSYAQQDAALEKYPLGSLPALPLRLLNESFPPAPANVTDVQNFAGPSTDPAANLVAVIDGTLLEWHQACLDVFGTSEDLLYVTGGPTRSQQVLQRIEAIWRRPLQTFNSAGASYGAAMAAMLAETRYPQK